MFFIGGRGGVNANQKNFKPVSPDWPECQRYEIPADSTDFNGYLQGFLHFKPFGRHISRLFSLAWQSQHLQTLLLYKPQELFASFDNETTSPIHNDMRYSYFRNVTEHKRCCHSKQSFSPSVTSCKEAKQRNEMDCFMIRQQGETSLCLNRRVFKTPQILSDICNDILWLQKLLFQKQWDSSRICSFTFFSSYCDSDSQFSRLHIRIQTSLI